MLTLLPNHAVTTCSGKRSVSSVSLLDLRFWNSLGQGGGSLLNAAPTLLVESIKFESLQLFSAWLRSCWRARFWRSVLNSAKAVSYFPVLSGPRRR